jgi:hypothetical protein
MHAMPARKVRRLRWLAVLLGKGRLMLIMSRLLSAPFPLVAIILALAFFGSGVAPADTETSKGAVVVARSAPTMLLIWDASPAVGDLVIAQRTGDQGMRALEGDAIAILGRRAVRSHAARIELHVQYVSGGVVGAAYQASTFANATPLMIISAARPAAATRYREWIGDVVAGRKPPGLDVRITGTFPKSE